MCVYLRNVDAVHAAHMYAFVVMFHILVTYQICSNLIDYLSIFGSCKTHCIYWIIDMYLFCSDISYIVTNWIVAMKNKASFVLRLQLLNLAVFVALRNMYLCVYNLVLLDELIDIIHSLPLILVLSFCVIKTTYNILFDYCIRNSPHYYSYFIKKKFLYDITF